MNGSGGIRAGQTRDCLRSVVCGLTTLGIVVTAACITLTTAPIEWWMKGFILTLVWLCRWERLRNEVAYLRKCKREVREPQALSASLIELERIC